MARDSGLAAPSRRACRLTRARAQAGNALPNEWLFQAWFSVQLMGTDGSGCLYNASAPAPAGYISTWYGDNTPPNRATPSLGLFFPITVTLVSNPLGAGVGGDTTNVVQQATNCGSTACNTTAWVGVPTGGNSWYSSTYPAPYITLPASAWPSSCNGVINFAGSSYAAAAFATPAAASSATRAGAAVAVLAAAVVAALL